MSIVITVVRSHVRGDLVSAVSALVRGAPGRPVHATRAGRRGGVLPQRWPARLLWGLPAARYAVDVGLTDAHLARARGGQEVTDSRSALPVGEADVLPEAVLEVDAGLLDDGLRAGGAGEEPGQGEGAGELAVRGDQVRVRGQGCPVDL